MYYIPCNYILLKQVDDRSSAKIVIRDNIELSRVRRILTLPGVPSSTKPPRAGDEELSCGDVDRLARSHLADVRARMADLQRMASELERVIASCHGGQRAECTILSTLRQTTSVEATRQ